MYGTHEDNFRRDESKYRDAVKTICSCITSRKAETQRFLAFDAAIKLLSQCSFLPDLTLSKGYVKESPETLCAFIAFGFGAFALWCGYEYYQLAAEAIKLNSIMPDATLAVTAMSVVVGALLSYLLYQMGLKNSRNKYGIGEDGQPFKSKVDVEPSVEEYKEMESDE